MSSSCCHSVFLIILVSSIYIVLGSLGLSFLELHEEINFKIYKFFGHTQPKNINESFKYIWMVFSAPLLILTFIYIAQKKRMFFLLVFSLATLFSGALTVGNYLHALVIFSLTGYVIKNRRDLKMSKFILGINGFVDRNIRIIYFLMVCVLLCLLYNYLLIKFNAWVTWFS